jgi:hypothetical protein
MHKSSHKRFATGDPLTSAAVVELAEELAIFSFRSWLEL